jgi:predicted permease
VQEALVTLFVTTIGLTTSGIVANVYRLLAGKEKALAGKAVYFAVMVVAGPSVLFDKAARSRHMKECSTVAFALAAAVAFYWSLAIGLFVVEFALALFHR